MVFEAVVPNRISLGLQPAKTIRRSCILWLHEAAVAACISLELSLTFCVGAVVDVNLLPRPAIFHWSRSQYFE